MNESYVNQIGNNIMRLRKERDMTQEQLANALGISYQAVSKWETGNSCPDISALPLLADLFSVSIDALFGRETAEPQTPAPIPEAAPLPWPDDESFYAVLYHGHKLIGHDQGGPAEEARLFRFEYEGPAQNVNSDFAVSCGDVEGSVTAGTEVSCGDVGESVHAGTAVTCADVGENAHAGTELQCGDVGHNATAGGNLNCSDVGGAASAGRDLTCEDVGGGVAAGGSVQCGDVRGGVIAGGRVESDGEDPSPDSTGKKKGFSFGFKF